MFKAIRMEQTLQNKITLNMWICCADTFYTDEMKIVAFVLSLSLAMSPSATGDAMWVQNTIAKEPACNSTYSGALEREGNSENERGTFRRQKDCRSTNRKRSDRSSVFSAEGDPYQKPSSLQCESRGLPERSQPPRSLKLAVTIKVRFAYTAWHPDVMRSR